MALGALCTVAQPVAEIDGESCGSVIQISEIRNRQPRRHTLTDS